MSGQHPRSRHAGQRQNAGVLLAGSLCWLGRVRSPMPDGTTIALREVILHMVEEYARHLGHADLLRERIDGRIGQ